ncbi:MAG: RluA family pseudouridine synthase [Adlercreutzia equolifaciens]
MLVLSKQIGLVCHPSVDHAHGTLVNALIWHCGEDNLCNVQGEEADRLGIVHRLDRDTSGLMLAAKTDEAGRELMAQIQDRAVDRHYIALVHGIMAHDTGMIDAPIARSAERRCRMSRARRAERREAITTFRVLERFEAGPKDDGYSLIECKLFTGRTHQIRVHMQYTRHPIVGDPVYNAHGPRDAGPSWGCAASSYIPTASPSSTRRPASPWPSPTICRATCRKRSIRWPRARWARPRRGARWPSS